MNSLKPCILTSAVLWALIAASCTSPSVEIDANPKQVNSGDFVEVTWSTQDFETTTISSNPTLSGLPKTVTGDDSGVDKFAVTATTTFEIKGQTADYDEVASSTVTVSP